MSNPALISPEKSGFRKLKNFLGYLLILLIIATSIVERTSLMTPPVRFLLASTIITALVYAILSFVSSSKIKPIVAYPSIFFLALFMTWAIAANKQPDINALRNTYVKQLVAYVSIPYKEGGETSSGIDDSGLARCALWQAMLIEGGKEFNSRLLGPKLWKLWWRDLTTDDLLNGKYGYTYKINRVLELAGYDEFNLEKGDLAITDNPKQVLIYVGHNQWISSDKKSRMVIKHNAFEASTNPILNTQATIVRWKIMKTD